MQRFNEKVVIVAGADSGIGRATAIAFAREGAQVVIADIIESDGGQTVATIQAEGGKAHYSQVDASSASSVDTLIRSTVSVYGWLDIYFSNAGILDSFLPCTQIDDEIWNRVIGVNLSACFYGARAAFPHLANTRGNIVMTASVAALGAMAGGAAYTASKYGPD